MTKSKFTIEDLRLKEDARAIRTVQSKEVTERLRRRREHFVRVPMAWAERLNSARSAGVVMLALHILYEHWRAGGRPFRLANATLEQKGINRERKRAGLRRLEELGLVTVLRQPRKSPIVTVLTVPAAKSVTQA